MATPIAGLKTMPTNTIKNEAIFNEDLILLEALTYRGVVSRSLLDPSTISSPAPSNGTIYLVPDGSPNAVGEWASHGGDVAVYFDGWRYLPPAEGLTLWVTDEAQSIQYRSGAWIDRNELPPTNLTDLADVSLAGSPSPQDGESLTYNAALGVWMAGAGGGGGGTPVVIGSIDFSVNSPTTTEAAARQISGLEDYRNIFLAFKGMDRAETSALRMRLLTVGGSVGVTGIYDGTLWHVGVSNGRYGQAAADHVNVGGLLNPQEVDNIHGTISGHWSSVIPTRLEGKGYDNDATGTDTVVIWDYVTTTTTIYGGISFLTASGTVAVGVVTVYGWN
jgi:hypothetical protein